MGDVLSATSDDMQDYSFLCKRYGEEPQSKPDAWGNSTLDCYGKHARGLKQRLREERDSTRAMKKPPLSPSVPTFKKGR